MILLKFQKNRSHSLFGKRNENQNDRNRFHWVGIDVPEDLEKAKAILSRDKSTCPKEEN